MLNSEDFARLILSYGSFSHKKLQKLCYYVYSWYLTMYNEKIADISFEAWIHGPVSPEIYYSYKNYGWRNIPKYEGNLSINIGLQEVTSRIITEYLKYNANELEKLTHEEMPWKLAREGYGKYEPSNELIRDTDIVNFYKNNELHDSLFKEFFI